MELERVPYTPWPLDPFLFILLRNLPGAAL